MASIKLLEPPVVYLIGIPKTFFICNNTREYNAYNTLTNSTLFRLLTELALFTYCSNYLHYFNHNMYTTYSTLLTNTVMTRGEEKKEKNR